VHYENRQSAACLYSCTIDEWIDLQVTDHLDLFPYETTLFVEDGIAFGAVKNNFVAPRLLCSRNECFHHAHTQTQTAIVLIYHNVFDVPAFATLTNEFQFDQESRSGDDLLPIHICEWIGWAK